MSCGCMNQAVSQTQTYVPAGQAVSQTQTYMPAGQTVSQTQTYMPAGQTVDQSQAYMPVSCPGTAAGNIQQYPVAMGYVPWQQWQQTYSLDQGLSRGTIFPELDLPFVMGRYCS